MKIKIGTPIVAFCANSTSNTSTIEKGEYEVKETEPLDSKNQWYQIERTKHVIAVDHQLASGEVIFP